MSNKISRESGSLAGQVVVITGGAGLLGREFVAAVSEQQGIAVIADVNTEAAERTRASLSAKLKVPNIESVTLDITSTVSIQKMIESLHKRYGKIDAIVNNAYPRNKHYGRPFFEVEYDDFCENMSIHLGGYFLVSQQLAAYFKKQGHGNIVNIASIYGIIPPRFEVYQDTAMTMPVEYAVIKSALIHLTKYMAKYLKGSNVRVNTISPGGILNGQPDSFLTKYNEMGLSKGMLNPVDLKGALVFLLSESSCFVNGHNLTVDDGWSL